MVEEANLSSAFPEKILTQHQPKREPSVPTPNRLKIGTELVHSILLEKWAVKGLAFQFVSGFWLDFGSNPAQN